MSTINDTLPTVLLKPGEADRIVAGHPWIYQNEILRLTQPATDGDLVQAKDHRQRLLGTGFYNSKSKIGVRLLSMDRIKPDAERPPPGGRGPLCWTCGTG